MSAAIGRSATILGLLVLAAAPLRAQVAAGAAPSCPAGVADSTTASVVPPTYLNGPAPKYPASLRQNGVGGVVRLRFTVGCDGRVDSTTVEVSSSADTMFTRSAVTAIIGSEFSPARVDGRVMSYRMDRMIRFQLTNR